MTTLKPLTEGNNNLCSPYKIIKGKNGSTSKFFLNDCIMGMKNSLEESSIDVIVTSPPYNIGINYNIYKDNKLRKEYCITCLDEYSRIRIDVIEG